MFEKIQHLKKIEIKFWVNKFMFPRFLDWRSFTCFLTFRSELKLGVKFEEVFIDNKSG